VGQRIAGMIVVMVLLLVAGVPMAQSSGPGPEASSWSIVPVTGPSMATLTEPGKPEVIAAVATGEAMSGPVARTGSSGTRAATRAVHAAPRAIKAHKPAAKATAKKAATPKHVTARTGAAGAKHVVKDAHPARPRHVAAAKGQAPARHVAVSKPIPLAKSPAGTKGAAPTQPVLPRV
jgi:hypothetical protein